MRGWSHHAGVDRSLLYITSDAGHKRVPVFKVGVKISLQTEGEVNKRIISQQMTAQSGMCDGASARKSVPGTWWRKEGARCMAAGPGGATPPAGQHWTGRPPGSRGSSSQRGVTHTKPHSGKNKSVGENMTRQTQQLVQAHNQSSMTIFDCLGNTPSSFEAMSVTVLGYAAGHLCP